MFVIRLLRSKCLLAHLTNKVTMLPIKMYYHISVILCSKLNSTLMVSVTIDSVHLDRTATPILSDFRISTCNVFPIYFFAIDIKRWIYSSISSHIPFIFFLDKIWAVMRGSGGYSSMNFGSKSLNLFCLQFGSSLCTISSNLNKFGSSGLRRLRLVLYLGVRFFCTHQSLLSLSVMTDSKTSYSLWKRHHCYNHLSLIQ